MFPVEGEGDESVASDKPTAIDPKRPAFSLPLMTQNFRRFNARQVLSVDQNEKALADARRIGIVFALQNQIERLLNWRKTSHTISFLFVYSFVCIDPHILAILPIAAILVYVMVPAFIARHPPPPSSSTSSTTPYYSYEGPALAPPKTIEPASETSKDFFRNLRDLQNCMADFSDLHDSVISMFAPVTDFSNEKLASVTFLLLSVTAVLLFPAAHLLPWRYILLVGGNAVILSNHPGIQEFFRTLINDLINETTDHEPSLVEKEAQDLFGISLPSSPSATMSALGPLAEISLDAYTEEREVEIFELQFWSPDPYADSKWEHFIFSPVPHDPLSPARIAGDRPRGCRFFEDVQPPSGWAWKSKKWELDMDSREWVVERMITGVGFEIPGSGPEGSASSDEVGGWVWDLPLKNTNARDEDDPIAAFGYSGASTPVSSPEGGSPQQKPTGKGKLNRDFEEEKSVGSYGIGEWRRRRWVRIVHRVSVEDGH